MGNKGAKRGLLMMFFSSIFSIVMGLIYFEWNIPLFGIFSRFGALVFFGGMIIFFYNFFREKN